MMAVGPPLKKLSGSAHAGKPHLNVKVYMPIFARTFDKFYLWYASRYTCMSKVLINPIPLRGCDN